MLLLGFRRNFKQKKKKKNHATEHQEQQNQQNQQHTISLTRSSGRIFSNFWLPNRSKITKIRLQIRLSPRGRNSIDKKSGFRWGKGSEKGCWEEGKEIEGERERGRKKETNVHWGNGAGGGNLGPLGASSRVELRKKVNFSRFCSILFVLFCFVCFLT